MYYFEALIYTQTCPYIVTTSDTDTVSAHKTVLFNMVVTYSYWASLILDALLV